MEEKKELQEINGKPLTRSQIELIKRTVAKNTSDDEFKIFLHMAKKHELDPFLKQIWCIKFGTDPAQIFTSRDGFLDIAHRSNKFDGMETKVEKTAEGFEITFYNRKTKLYETFKSDFQYVSTTTVYRKDYKYPFIVTVYEEEYSTGRNLWTTKRRTMIGKVSESQCLRKAFSISGIYAPEERGQDIVVEAKETELKAEAVETKDHNFLEYIITEIQRGHLIWNSVSNILEELEYIDKDAKLYQIKKVISDLKIDEIQPIKDKINILLQENKEKTSENLFSEDEK